MRRPNWLLLSLILLLAGLVTACSIGAASEEEIAANAYLEAVLQNDEELLAVGACANVPAGSGSQDLLSLWSVGLALKAAGADFGIEDLQVDIDVRKIGSEDNGADVRMRGTVEIPAELRPSEQMPLPAEDTVQLDEVWRMVDEDGTWKWCGGVLEE